MGNQIMFSQCPSSPLLQSGYQSDQECLEAAAHHLFPVVPVHVDPESKAELDSRRVFIGSEQSVTPTPDSLVPPCQNLSLGSEANLKRAKEAFDTGRSPLHSSHGPDWPRALLFGGSETTSSSLVQEQSETTSGRTTPHSENGLNMGLVPLTPPPKPIGT